MGTFTKNVYKNSYLDNITHLHTYLVHNIYKLEFYYIEKNITIQ